MMRDGTKPRGFDDAVEALRRGGAALFPTDTVFGLGVSVGHASDASELYAIKGRDEGKPIAWLVADAGDLATYGVDVPPYATALARELWPGALTIIVKAGAAVPAGFLTASGTIGLRMPDSATARALIRAVGSPLATTSANRSGLPAVGRAEDLDPRIVAAVGGVVDDDVPEGGVASTVVDCTGEHPRIVREGPIAPRVSEVLARVPS